MERNLENFYIISQSGFSMTTTLIFNIKTYERKAYITWDIDNAYYEEINKDVAKLPRATKQIKDLYEHHMGFIKIGDLVQVVKGRKLKGECKRVANTFDYKISDYNSIPYLVFEDGTKVSEYNCKLIKEYDRYAI